MVLRAPYVSIAVKLQEAADMMHSDVRSRLSDAVNDMHRGSGKWGGYVDHSGDGESGDVIYNSGGDLRKAGYEIQTQGGKAVANIDHENSTNVVPCTTYQEEADDDDNYASMMESKLYTKGERPLTERFISKAKRDTMDSGSFAGKGKSYPIDAPGDIMAAVHSIGRAGSDNYGPAQLKANIIRIAKAKGWASSLPKAWQGESASESGHKSDTSAASSAGGTGDGGRRASESGRISSGQDTTVSRGMVQTIELRESIDWRDEEAVNLIESAGTTRMKIKLIAPGKGSSAIYPAEVLKRDGPGVFKDKTHIYINHATQAEEAARPEGDWHKLVGALDGNAYWDESAKQGPGLYGDALFTSEYAPLLKEKAAFTGMSIRANGDALFEAGKKVIREGLPVLAKLTSAESVDVVTRAGAGGMILTENARPNQQEGEMTLQEVQKLIDEGVAKATTPLRERALRGDATVIAARVLSPLSLNEAAKQMVVENVLRGDLPLKENALDETKFTELVTIEAKRVGAVLGASFPGVHGMGAGEPVDITLSKKERKALKEAAKEEEEEAISVYESLGMPRDAAILAAKGRAA